MHRTTIRSAVFICAVAGLYLASTMLIPAIVDLYFENDDWQVFAISAFLIGGASLAIATATYGGAPTFSARLGFLVVNFLWITLSVVGAVPFYMSSLQLGIADSLFESISAVTTTGSTVITGLDSLPPGILLWRSLLQWIGGIGIVGMGLFVLPYLKVGGFAFFRLESSDTNDKPFARFASFARALVLIYIFITVVCAVLYDMAGMTEFDAINHALTTVSTGGFSTHDNSLGHFDSLPILWISTIFMLIGALPFSILIVLVVRGRLDTMKDPQIVVFLGLVAALSIVIAIYHRLTNGVGALDAFTHSLFTITSIVTTTGYASQDYTAWGPLVVAIVFFATFLGGCSGSTAGGMKTYRFIIIFNAVSAGLRSLLYPHSISTVRYGGRTIDADATKHVFLFFSAYAFLTIVGTVLMAGFGYDFMTASTAALTSISNVGPGLGDMIGPSGSFASLHDAAKMLLAVLMLLGRLEVLTVLVVLTPMFWRE